VIQTTIASAGSSLVSRIFVSEAGQMQSDFPYKCVAAAIVFAASALAGENPSGGEIVWPQTPQNDLAVPNTTRSPENLVSAQELQHRVPGKAQKEMEKARKALSNEQLDEAIDHLKQVISIDPEWVAARNNLAVVYLTHSNVKLGVEELEEAVKVAPRNPTLFTNLTVAYHQAHRLDDAERAARLAVNLDRTSFRPRMLLGVVLMEKRKFTDETLQYLRRSIPDYPLAHLLAGGVLIAQAKFEEAKSEIQSYLASGQPENRELAGKWLDIIAHKAQSTR
jgi:tetratricopeptide (TPR) repeat protein